MTKNQETPAYIRSIKYKTELGEKAKHLTNTSPSIDGK